MSKAKTAQLVTTSISTYTLTPNDYNRNDSEARYQRILGIIRKDLADQESHLFQEIGRLGSMSGDLVVSTPIEAGPQYSDNPTSATRPELHDLAVAVNNKCDAESSNLGQASRSP